MKILLLAGLAAALSLSACTPGSTSTTSLPPTSSTTTTTTIAAADAVAAFLVCMSDEGAAIDSLPLDSSGRPRMEYLASQLDLSDPVVIEAMSRCSIHLSEGALDLGYDDEYRAAVNEQLAAFSRCVRARGVEDFPDPVQGFIGIGPPFPAAEIPYNDPELAAAVDACERTVFGELAGTDS